MQAISSIIGQQHPTVPETRACPAPTPAAALSATMRVPSEPGWKNRIAEGAAVGIGSAAAYEAIKAILIGAASL